MQQSFWSVPREWDGLTCYVVAGGPSVASQPVERLEGKPVIAINASWERVPFAQFCLFADTRFGRNVEYRSALQKRYRGRVVTCAGIANVPWPGLLRMNRLPFVKGQRPIPGLATAPDTLAVGYTTVHAALNLAFHLGARRVVLLGADLGMSPDGRCHHHAPHPWPVKPGCWDLHLQSFEAVAGPLAKAGIEVINASPASRERIDFWPYRPLEECL